MKCSEVKNFFQPLLDNEIDLPEKHEIKTHLDICDFCRADFEYLKTTQKLLKKQPQILPKVSFDNQVLQDFENLQSAKQKSRKGGFTGLFSIPKPALAFGVLTVALGLTFLLGRMSVTSSPQIIVKQQSANPELKKDEIKPPIVNSVKDKTAASPAIKTVIKYVEVPVVKEKIVERTVYLNKPNQKNRIENINIKNQSMIAKSGNITSQFNLKDLQPVANVTYKIIRKGENNDE
ncbi:MAG: hypothetical protein WKF90_15145 [Pyrinomonadaceae bacterium]